MEKLFLTHSLVIKYDNVKQRNRLYLSRGESWKKILRKKTRLKIKGMEYRKGILHIIPKVLYILGGIILETGC